MKAATFVSFAVELLEGSKTTCPLQFEQEEPRRNKSPLPVSNWTAHFAISFDVCSTQNSDWPFNATGGEPTLRLPVHTVLLLSVRGTVIVGESERRPFESPCFDARGWGLPVFFSMLACRLSTSTCPLASRIEGFDKGMWERPLREFLMGNAPTRKGSIANATAVGRYI